MKTKTKTPKFNGLTVTFTGPPGCGKTIAQRIVRRELVDSYTFKLVSESLERPCELKLELL